MTFTSDTNPLVTQDFQPRTFTNPIPILIYLYRASWHLPLPKVWFYNVDPRKQYPRKVPVLNLFNKVKLGTHWSHTHSSARKAVSTSCGTAIGPYRPRAHRRLQPRNLSCPQVSRVRSVRLCSIAAASNFGSNPHRRGGYRARRGSSRIGRIRSRVRTVPPLRL